MARRAFDARFTLAIVGALALHLMSLPAANLAALRWLLPTLWSSTETEEPTPTDVELPVDLDLLREAPQAEGDPAGTPGDRGAGAIAGPTGSGPSGGPGTPGAATPPTQEPAAENKPETPTAEPPQDKPIAAPAKTADDFYSDISESREKEKHAKPKLSEPIAQAGGPGKLGPKDPNVQILFNGKGLRANAAGAKLGELLTALPDWHQFFKGTSIDPVKDFEHLLIAGPQLRQSKDVIVWAEYKVPEADMRAALDQIVKRTKRGRWLPDSPVPAAVGRAHGARRIFALIPEKKLLVILPGKRRDLLDKLRSVRAFNQASSTAIAISMVTPSNAFEPYKDVIDMPKSIAWMRLSVKGQADGSASVSLELKDASPEQAATHATHLTKEMEKIRGLARAATFGLSDVIGPVTFTAERDLIRAEATVTQRQLQHILNLARTHLKQVEPPKEEPDDSDPYEDTPAAASASAAPSATPSAAPSTSASAAPSSDPSLSAPWSKKKVNLKALVKRDPAPGDGPEGRKPSTKAAKPPPSAP